jgi:hypothetical protein
MEIIKDERRIVIDKACWLALFTWRISMLSKYDNH